MPGLEGFIKNNIQNKITEPATLQTFKAGAEIFEGTIDFMVM